MNGINATRIAVAALALATSIPALAAVPVVAVTNALGPTPVGFFVNSTSWRAESFTTGSQAFVLDSVVLQVNLAFSPNLSVWVYSDNAGQPGASMELLANGGQSGRRLTQLSTGLALAPTTTYWVVAGATVATPNQLWAANASNAETGLPGWSIGDSSLGSTNQGTSWSVSPTEVQMTINVTPAVPEPATIALWALGGLALLAAGRRRPG